MALVVDERLINQFAGFLVTLAGWSFPAGRREELRRGLEAAAPELGYPDAESCMLGLMNKPVGRGQIEVLARYLTVGETYFFREPGVFAALEQRVLPELIAARRRSGNLSLRLWSAACCSGEEPYSLAILLSRLLPDLAAWRITLLATDINPYFLSLARAARYKGWSFRNAPPWLLPGYFSAAADGSYQLQPQIRRMVSFNYLNLVDDSYPALDNNTNAMDLILCRNVLMYFSLEQVQRVAEQLRHALLDSGWLVVSAAETNQALFRGFSPVNFPDAVLYRKGVRQPPAAPPAALAWPPLQVEPEPEPPAPVIAAPPEPAPSPYASAQALYQHGQYAAAAQALAEQSDDASALLLLARISANLGRLEQAARCCEQAIGADKLNPAGHYLLAAILDEQGQPEAALAALKRALYLEPQFVLAHFALGNLARRLGKRGADKHLDNALALLAGYPAEAVLPESEGLTAGRLAEIIQLGRGSV